MYLLPNLSCVRNFCLVGQSTIHAQKAVFSFSLLDSCVMFVNGVHSFLTTNFTALVWELDSYKYECLCNSAAMCGPLCVCVNVEISQLVLWTLK